MTTATTLAIETQVLLTLFTTFRQSADSHLIHYNTIVNWASLQPLGVRLVLYADVTSNDSVLFTEARTRGWKIRPCPAMSPSKVPVLRHMFLDAESSSRSTFYGYANADILFDAALPRTLADILPHLDHLRRPDRRGLLITGVRSDCVVDGETNTCDDLRSASRFSKTSRVAPRNRKLPHNVSDVALKPSSLIRDSKSADTLTSAQDYFITVPSGLPWHTMPDMVVGRAGVDNWLLVTSLKSKKAVVIDASETVAARHQVPLGYHPSAHYRRRPGPLGALDDARTNYQLAGPAFDYSLGLTDCAPFYTDFLPITSSKIGNESEAVVDDETPTDDVIVIVRSRQLNRYCKRALLKSGINPRSFMLRNRFR